MPVYELVPHFIFFFYTHMMYADKAEIIQECIDKIVMQFPRWKDSTSERAETYREIAETLEQFKTEVDALAEQEAKKYAEKEKANNEKNLNDYMIANNIYYQTDINTLVPVL